MPKIISLLCALALVVIPCPGPASDIVNGIAAAMDRLTRVAPRHPVQRDSEWRRELAEMIVAAADVHGVDPFLLLTVAFCESTLRPAVLGSLGERGLGQVHGVAAKGCDLSTPQGEIECTARHLALCRTLCDGSTAQTLARYATGGVCKPRKGGRLDGLVRRRVRIYRRLLSD